MNRGGIPLDKAELLSVVLEAILYGFSLLMFGATIWMLVVRPSTSHVNRKVFMTAACLLLLGSTAHMVVNIIRVMEGVIMYRDTYPGGPAAYFANVSHWTFVSKSYIFTAQTMIGDGAILYRCYLVWQSKLAMILPALLWCAFIVTGIGTSITASRVTQQGVFGGSLARWITSFWVTALATNLLTTLLMVYRLWYIDRKTSGLREHQRSQLRPVLRALVHACTIYSLVLSVTLVLFVSGSNGQYVILAMVIPIISITFYMPIVQAGLAVPPDQKNTLLGDASRHHHERRTNAENRIYITKFTETSHFPAGRSECPSATVGAV